MKKITFAALAVPLMWVLLLLLLFNSNKLHAQETMVLSGVVKSADGTPLEGVTVWQKDSDNGTQTDSLGFYSLEVSSGSYLVFEYIGFKTQTVRVTGKVLNVTLVSDEDLLDEVVINAGYYSVRDKERTGSISKITAKEIGQQPVANPLAAMQGRMAGVNITQSSGTPGGGFDIQIRGRNSLRTEGNAPLYIVDGVPYLSDSSSSSLLAASILRNTANNPLQLINPSDIESIEVLKDADATAIYGSRGANGVVLITTKKGMEQPTVFTLQSHTAVGTVGRFMKLLNTVDYLKLREQAFLNDRKDTYPVNAYDINGTWDKDRYTDWQKELIGGQSVSQQVSASLRGGDKSNQFMVQASTAVDGTVFPGDYGNKRKNLLAQFSHTTPKERWKLNVQFIGGESSNTLLGTDLTGEALSLVPNAPALYHVDGNLNWENGTWNNPLRWLEQSYTAENVQWLTAWNLEGRLTNDLTLKLQAGYSEANGEERQLVPHTIYNPSWGLDSSSSSSLLNNSGSFNWNIEPQLHFTKKINNHKLNILLGTTFLKQESNRQVWSATNFASNSQIHNMGAAKTLQLVSNDQVRYAYQAVFTRINYQYADKYILNLTGRRDGSSRFGPDKRWGNFGAVGAAWLFSREKFLEESSWLNFGKLRISYGITGNDRIGDYQYLDTYGNSGGVYEIGGMYPMRLYNPAFSWETNKKREAALEWAMFDNKINLSVAYYQNESSDQLVGIPLPGTTGFSTVQANLPASVRNSGWEFETKMELINTTDWKWSLGANITINRNRLRNFPDLEGSTYKNSYAIGYPTSIVFVYEYTGIDPETGLYSFKDVNNDGKFTASDDRKTIVDLTPRYFAGIQQSLVYKGWTFTTLFQLVSQSGPNYLLGWGMPGSVSNQPVDFNRDDIQLPSAGFNPDAQAAFTRYTQSQAAYSDASYVRLKNMVIDYRLPDMLVNKLKGSIYISGQNLITWTKYRGLDPESLNNRVLPPLKVWSLGVVLSY